MTDKMREEFEFAYSKIMGTPISVLKTMRNEFGKYVETEGERLNVAWEIYKIMRSQTSLAQPDDIQKDNKFVILETKYKLLKELFKGFSISGCSLEKIEELEAKLENLKVALDEDAKSISRKEAFELVRSRLPTETSDSVANDICNTLGFNK